MGMVFAASAGFSSDWIVLTSAMRGAELDSAAQAGADPGDELFNIQLALDARQKVGRFLGCPGILQIIQRAAIGDSAHESGKLERRLGNFLAEAGEHADTPVCGRRGREAARTFTRDIQARLLPIAKLVRVVAVFFEAYFLTERGEEVVVGVSQRVSEIHPHAIEPKLRLRLDDFLTEGGQGNRDFDGRTRLESRA